MHPAALDEEHGSHVRNSRQSKDICDTVRGRLPLEHFAEDEEPPVPEVVGIFVRLQQVRRLGKIGPDARFDHLVVLLGHLLGHVLQCRPLLWIGEPLNCVFR